MAGSETSAHSSGLPIGPVAYSEVLNVKLICRFMVVEGSLMVRLSGGLNTAEGLAFVALTVELAGLGLCFSRGMCENTIGLSDGLPRDVATAVAGRGAKL